ncbi:protein no-on-transient A-like isoform X2 [Teleopsis dalmanni]|uniref:protein no-on-transient A-like isoform X2 n=1 Tax=Teleopsis dalmanni TaxID=139649 RepID=UPI0018CE78DA|nr:protein no-on-transient A-like isoform X2 [Teleopsis dalmanni]
METATRNENAGPLPQRPQKNQNKNLKKPTDAVDNGPSEKKPRFNQGGGPNAGAGGGNQNKGNAQGNAMNKNFGGNRNRGGGGGNRGGQQNRNFQNQNQNQNQQNQNQPNQNQNQNQPNQNQNQPNQNQNQNQNQQNQNQQNQNQQNSNQNQTDIKTPLMGGNQDGGNQDNRPQHQNQNQNRNRGGGGGGRNRDRDHSRGGGGGRGGNQGNQSGIMGRNDEFHIGQRLRAIAGPTHELPTLETASAEPKFSGRNRLYVGNLTTDTTEEDLIEIFKPYGEIGEIFSNPEKNFTFLKVDYHSNAEKAKRELDGSMRKGRAMRVRFAPNATILRVRNLTPFVSNELLYKAFEIFGPVERASIVVDDRGKSTGEGIVEFEKKSTANSCLRLCNDRCYFLTTSLRPCVVEPMDINDDTDGLPEKSLNKKTQEFHHERNVGPRFADVDSFEHEYGTRWKQLHELFKSKQEALKRELKMEEEKLDAQMEYARYEHETELLRQELRKRESDNERKKMEWELREKQAEDMRKRDEENMRRQQTEMQSRMMRQEEEMRRRQQENTLFMQAQQLNTLLDQQEVGFNLNGNNFDNNFGGANNSPFEFRGNNANNTNNCGPNGGQNNQDPFTFEFGGNNQNQAGQGNRGGNNGGNNNNNNPWERRRRF